MYYIISRIIFLILILFKNFDLSFWTTEIVFPAFYSMISIISAIIIHNFIKKIDNLIRSNNFKKNDFFNSFPNKYIFFIMLGVSIILNLEGILTNRLNNFQYYLNLMGVTAIILNRLEIWQNSFFTFNYFWFIRNYFPNKY